MCVYYSVIDLFNIILLLISFLQVELALNKVTYVRILPHVNSKHEIIKTSHVHNFFCFLLYWKRSEKEVGGRAGGGGSPCIQQTYSHTKLTQRPSALHFVEFFTRCARLMYDLAGGWIMNNVASRDE